MDPNEVKAPGPHSSLYLYQDLAVWSLHAVYPPGPVINKSSKFPDDFVEGYPAVIIRTTRSNLAITLAPVAVGECLWGSLGADMAK